MLYLHRKTVYLLRMNLFFTVTMCPENDEILRFFPVPMAPIPLLDMVSEYVYSQHCIHHFSTFCMTIGDKPRILPGGTRSTTLAHNSLKAYCTSSILCIQQIAVPQTMLVHRSTPSRFCVSVIQINIISIFRMIRVSLVCNMRAFFPDNYTSRPIWLHLVK